jgi:hypothetical protein
MLNFDATGTVAAAVFQADLVQRQLDRRTGPTAWASITSNALTIRDVAAASSAPSLRRAWQAACSLFVGIGGALHGIGHVARAWPVICRRRNAWGQHAMHSDTVLQSNLIQRASHAAANAAAERATA